MTIGKKNILAGLKNGDVYELSMAMDEDDSSPGKIYNLYSNCRE